ncbi:MAG TPA: O-methyltransferase [Puia sp.]|jgi:predicted O-methyltransferase YrrM|nr:O-methyltransferase [Puia sp.]
MEIVNVKAQEYSEKFSSAEDDLLSEIAKFTNKHHADPHMLSGHVQGKFLEIISCLLQPKRILEIGTFVGYSALCLAKGLPKEGKLHTIELRKDDADISVENFRKSNMADKIILHTGNALEIIPALHETWDLVFIDADKPNYINYYNLVLPKLRVGGLIIADNVLFHGEVLEEEIKGKNAKAIHAFNEMINKDDSVEKVMLTVRDGLFLIRKK